MTLSIKHWCLKRSIAGQHCKWIIASSVSYYYIHNMTVKYQKNCFQYQTIANNIHCKTTKVSKIPFYATLSKYPTKQQFLLNNLARRYFFSFRAQQRSASVGLLDVMQLYVFVNKLRKTSLALACVREFNGWPNFLSTGIIVEKNKHNSMLNVWAEL